MERSFACLIGLLIVITSGCGVDKEPALEVEQNASANTASANTASANYVGNDSCAGCHEEIYASYKRTGMGRSVSLFDAETAPEDFSTSTEVYSERSNYYYTSFVRNDTLFQREFRKDDAGNVIHERVHPVEWVIGSGNATRSYLMNVNGHITQMPLTWYVEKEKWDLSPSYEQRNHRFERPIGQECMTCHNGLPEFSPFTQNHFENIPLGITCERCHGPGSEHVDLRLAGLGPGQGDVDESIVNPAHLDRARQLSVCQQCHLTGIAVFAPEEDVASYKPGNLLDNHRSVFVIEEQLTDPQHFGIASHAERLARSKCYQASEMTCLTCHNPHVPVAELDDNYFNNACIGCHTPVDEAGPIVCSREDAVNHAEAMTGNCVGCHLQKSGTNDIPHVTFTDHWIRRTLPPAQAPGEIERGLTRSTPFNLVRADSEQPINDPQRQLEEAIAYFTFYDTEHRLPAYLPQIIEKSRAALNNGADHPEGRLALAKALIELDSLAQAKNVLEDAVVMFPEHARLYFWEGEVYMKMNDVSKAIQAFQRSVQLAPDFLQAQLKLSSALSAAQRFDEAERVLLQVVQENPVHLPDAWNNLGFIYLQTQRLREAAQMFDKATGLDPDLATAWANAGTVHLMQQQFEQAAGKFERALAADPAFIPALGNLSIVYRQQGKIDEARQVLRRLLTFQPNDQNALTLLRELDAL